SGRVAERRRTNRILATGEHDAVARVHRCVHRRPAGDRGPGASSELHTVAASHPTRRAEHWMYVYDEDKLTTRINCTEMLNSRNAPEGWTGVQAEVYF